MMDKLADQKITKRRRPQVLGQSGSFPRYRTAVRAKRRPTAFSGTSVLKRIFGGANRGDAARINAVAGQRLRMLSPSNRTALARLAWRAGLAVLAGLAIAALGILVERGFSSAYFRMAPYFADPAIATAPQDTNQASAQLASAQLASAQLASALRMYVGLETAAVAEPDEAALLGFSETFGWTEYVVQPGDSVTGIAARFSLSIGSIIAANAIENVKKLTVGRKLRIPNMDGLPYTVKAGDSLSRIASIQGIPLEALLDANDLESETIIPGLVLFLPGAKMNGTALKLALGELMRYPVTGLLSSGYGWRNDPFSGERRFHAAIDLAADTGTSVKAAMDGTIASLGFNAVYGKYLIVNHGNGFQTWYAHLNAYRTVKGAAVKQGQRIGDVGSTGYSTGPHLHFAVFKNGQAVNPLVYLTK